MRIASAVIYRLAEPDHRAVQPGSGRWAPCLGSELSAICLQGNKQVTRAAIEWYGPDRAGVSSRPPQLYYCKARAAHAQCELELEARPGL